MDLHEIAQQNRRNLIDTDLGLIVACLNNVRIYTDMGHADSAAESLKRALAGIESLRPLIDGMESAAEAAARYARLDELAAEAESLRARLNARAGVRVS